MKKHSTKLMAVLLAAVMLLPLTVQAVPAGEEARQSEHKDIAHPITAEFREYIQKKVLEAYDIEKKKGPQAARPVSAMHAIEEENDIEL